MIKKYAITFPGQGSQSIGMMNSFSNNEITKSSFDIASQIINVDLWKIITEKNDLINETIYTQPIMLVSGFVIWQILLQSEIKKPNFLAGHSLGEITALTASGVINYEDALYIVKKRSQLMQDAVPKGAGSMAAILGLSDEKVLQICKENSESEVIEAVNFNSPGQVVVAGHQSKIDDLLEVFKKAGAKRAVKLPVSVPSHCSLMKGASEAFLDFLNNLSFNTPQIPVIHNVNCEIYTDTNKIKTILSKQLSQPVQWTKTIDFMIKQGVDSIFEAGPNKVLYNLNRRIFKEGTNISVSTPEAIEEVKSSIQT